MIWRTLASGGAIAHVLTGAWSLAAVMARGDSGGWILAAVESLGPGIVALTIAVAATILTPLPAVLPHAQDV